MKCFNDLWTIQVVTLIDFTDRCEILSRTIWIWTDYIKHIGFRFHISVHTCNSWIPCEIRYQILKIGEVFAPPQQKFNDRKQSQITTKIVIFWHMRRLQYSLKAVKIWIHFIQSSEFKWRKTKTWHKISLKIVDWAK